MSPSKMFLTTIVTIFILFIPRNIIYGSIGTSKYLPVVDKGVFVITGVSTCEEGSGYCILGTDCTVDKEFVQGQGHCQGLRKAFTPRAYFVCCTTANSITTSSPVVNVTTSKAIINDDIGNAEANVSSDSSAESPESVDSSDSESESDDSSSWIDDGADNIQISVVTETSVKETISIEKELCDLQGGNGRREESNLLPRLAPTLSGHLKEKSRSQYKIPTCFLAAIVRVPSGNPYNRNRHESVIDPGIFVCTGAVIGKSLVLTSSTCANRIKEGNYKVAMGMNDNMLHHPSNGPTMGVIYKDIVKVENYRNNNYFVHLKEDYTTSMSNSVCSVCVDYSILNYTKAVSDSQSSPADNTIKIHNYDSQVSKDEECYVVGLSTQGKRDHMEMAKIHVAKQVAYSCANGTIAGGKFFCVQEVDHQQVCFNPRDSGTPLVCRNSDTYTLKGLFYRGFHCATNISPVYFNKV